MTGKARKQERDITVRLARYAPELRRLGVAGLELFGSTVRGRAGPGSDVDLLVEFSRPVSLLEFFRLQHRLEEMLGVARVDLVEKGAEHPALAANIRAEAVRVA
ncbi:MAG: nucleotidyltransferase family protein [Pseudomonadota bacterium]